MDPIVITPDRWRPSRRRVLQGGVAAGLVASIPVLPLPALAQERELDLVSQALDLAGATRTSSPLAAAAAHHGATSFGLSATAGAGHLRLPVVEVDEFRSLSVSWDVGPVADAAVRVRHAGVWSEWMDLHVDPGESPDPWESPLSGRRSSQPVWIDRADALELSLPEGADGVTVHRVHETERLVLTAAAATAGAAPSILPRSAWGAAAYNGSPVYAPVRLAIVHHSVNGNSYSAAQVPSLIRSMQRHHQEANGWNDIAYNFLVDKWGRVWEGRAGGVDRPVIGGHTYGCNTGTIGVCYIGDLRYDSMSPAVVNAITSLLSWKFNQVHAVAPVGWAFYAPVAYDPSRSKWPADVVDLHPTVTGHSHFGKTTCPASASPGVVNQILSSLSAVSDVRGITSAPNGATWIITANGQAVPREWWVPFHGSMAGLHLNAPMISLAPTASGKGYWMLAADGGIFSFGDAAFYGSTGAMRLNKPVVGMAATKTGKGYWLVAADGGIFSFGDAAFHGSTGAMRLNKPVIGMARTPSGNGYWLFASDGGIFTFGDAGFFGSAGGDVLSSPAVDVAVHPSGGGYWLALANGTVRAFNVPWHGNATASAGDPIVGIAATANGGGYWLVARSGKVSSFGDAS